MSQESTGWRDRLLELLAEGSLEFEGRSIEMRHVAEVLNRILSDPQLDTGLDRLNDSEFREAFLRLYAQRVEASGR